MSRAILPAIACIFLALYGCSEGQNTVIQESKSPDGKHNAVLYKQNGDLNTQNSLHVSILSSNADLEAEVDGNVLIGDAGIDRQAFEGPFELEWRSHDSLVLHYNERMNIIYSVKQFDNVVVISKPFEWVGGQRLD